MNNKQDVAAVYAPCWMYCEHLFQIFPFFFPPYLKNCTLSDEELQMWFITVKQKKVIICRDTTQNTVLTTWDCGFIFVLSLISAAGWSYPLRITAAVKRLLNHHLSHVFLSSFLFSSPHFSVRRTPSPAVPVVTRVNSSLSSSSCFPAALCSTPSSNGSSQP